MQHRTRSNRALMALVASLAAGGSLSAQERFAPLPPYVFPTSAARTYSICCADYDQDGDLDLFFAKGRNIYAQDELFLNDGQGRFVSGTGTHYPLGATRTIDAVTGDIDGDGDMDLVVSEFGAFRVMQNNGNGGFSSSQVLPGIGGVLAIGDLDGDGDLDVVSGKNSIIMWNNGNGTFSTSFGAIPTQGEDTTDIVVGDFDGDGDLDIAESNSVDFYYGTSGRTTLYLNDGSGNFVDASNNIPGNSQKYCAIVAGDFDDDGDLDLAVAGHQAGYYYGFPTPVMIFTNNGNASFTASAAQSLYVRDLACGDVDGDGSPDLVATTVELPWIAPPYHFPVLLNNGSGNLSAAPTTQVAGSSWWLYQCELADLDGDDDLDWILGDYSASPGDTIYFNLQRQLNAPQPPRIGNTYNLDAYLRHGPASTTDLAVVWISTGAANQQVPFGTLRIDPNAASPLPVATIPPAQGVTSLPVAIPNVPALVGTTLYSQAALVAFPNDVRLSNVVIDTILP